LGRPHGLRGEVSLHLHNEASDPLEFELPVSARLLHGGAPSESLEAAAAGRVVELLAVRPAARAWLATFAGVGDRTAAEALVGLELWLPREVFGPLEDGEVFVQDLIGYRAVDLAGRPRGIVKALLWNGAHDILRIVPGHDPGVHEDWLVPAVPEFLVSIDRGARVVVIDPHE
jgi:16S rRNA processing protein RimM